MRTAGCAVCASMATSTVMTCVSGSRTASQRSANVYTGSVNRSDDARLSPKCRSIRSLLQRFFSSCSHAASRARAHVRADLRDPVARRRLLHGDDAQRYERGHEHRLPPRERAERDLVSTGRRSVGRLHDALLHLLHQAVLRADGIAELLRQGVGAGGHRDEDGRVRASERSTSSSRGRPIYPSTTASTREHTEVPARRDARRRCRRCSAPIEPRSPSTGRRRRVVRRSAARAPRPRRRLARAATSPPARRPGSVAVRVVRGRARPPGAARALAPPTPPRLRRRRRRIRTHPRASCCTPSPGAASATASRSAWTRCSPATRCWRPRPRSGAPRSS